jgi:hypothetical protein
LVEFEFSSIEPANPLSFSTHHAYPFFCSKEFSLLVVIVNMGKGGHVKRKEPEGPEIMEAYEDNRLIFDQVGWYLYYTKLYGYKYALARVFAEIFNGQRA